MPADESLAKKPRVEVDARRDYRDWTLTLDSQNKYGYRRLAIPETSAQIEVMSSDGAYVPFKVRPGERGETEIHIVVHELR